MTRRALSGLTAAAVLWNCSALAADDGDEMDVIPEAVLSADPAPPPEATTGRHGRVYLESATTLPSWRANALGPPPGQREATWQQRADLDIRAEAALGEALSGTYSGRWNYFADDGGEHGSPGSFRHDLREAYLTWSPDDRDFLDAGRINQRDGVAFGFNPTDFFKTNAVVDRSSEDPRVLREGRLGVVMLRGQAIRQGGAVSVIYAPRLATPGTRFGTDRGAFNPGFDRTNIEHRWRVKASLDLAEDLAPDLLVYHEAGRTRVGVNLTHGIGDAAIAYVEWAGGRDAPLAWQAHRWAVRTGQLPASAPVAFAGGEDSFQNDVAAGFTYTFPDKLTVNLEYDYHQAGFGRAEFKRWFALAEANRHNASVFGQLWQIRAFASNQQQPLSRQQIFLRLAWDDALVRDLTLSGFAYWNTYDASALLQVTAEYHLNAAWTLGCTALANVGGTASERGSLPEAASLLVNVIRYF